MNKNDILRRLRYALNYNDAQMLAVFALAEKPIPREKLLQWYQREDQPDFLEMEDRELAAFLNGLITQKRGKKEGPAPTPERKLSHNLILRKLKIAFNWQAEDMLDIWALAGYKLSKHELSGFFRQPEHRNYRTCQDQVLRNFLHGLQVKLRPEDILPPDDDDDLSHTDK